VTATLIVHNDCGWYQWTCGIMALSLAGCVLFVMMRPFQPATWQLSCASAHEQGVWQTWHDPKVCGNPVPRHVGGWWWGWLWLTLVCHSHHG